VSLLRSLIARDEARSFPALAWDEWVNMFSFGSFPARLNQTLVGNREDIPPTYSGFATGAYLRNGVVYACSAMRQMIFSEATFKWRQLRGGVQGKLFGTPDLQILETPEFGERTGDLLARAMLHVDLSGNAFFYRQRDSHGDRIKLLRPDWMGILLGSRSGLSPEYFRSDNESDAEKVDYVYAPGGWASGIEPIRLGLSNVAHFAPLKDPLASYRGMSWMGPVLPQIMGHSAATQHKLRFFENGATPNMVVKTPPQITDKVKFTEWVQAFKQSHEGVANAYKTLYLGAGWDATVVGSSLQQMDFKATQGADETAIAFAAGLHATILGLSEGMQGSSLNSGNYQSTRRLVADKTFRPMWRNLCGSLEVIVPPPPGAQLWYDEAHIQFLAEDVKDAADVLTANITAVGQAVKDGFTRESAIDAVTSGDLSLLVEDPDWVSVQLQPGAGQAPQPVVVPSVQPPSSAPVPAPARDDLMLLAMRAIELAGRPQPAPNVNVTSPDVHVAPAEVHIESGAVQVMQERPATRTVIDHDDSGKVVGTHDE
jgi:phage portal protein BeeE